jgi:transposase-like protein
MATIHAPRYTNEEAARKHLEKTLWPEGPVCPHCGVIGEAFELNGKTTRKGLWKCSGCREPFTVTVGTIFEDSHIPLHKWLLAIHLMCSSKKGISAHQLWRNLWDVDPITGKQTGSYRTAWFMCHRIRWALGQEPMVSKLAGIVEVDDAYIGGKVRYATQKDGYGRSTRLGMKHPRSEKAPIVAILQRGGDVRTFHVPRVTGENVRPILDAFVEQNAHIMTDSANVMAVHRHGWMHSSVDHSKKEYVRYEDGLCITTNTVEGYFGIIKRGIYGVFHHVSQRYLGMYLKEFDFRYNVRPIADTDRVTLALKKAEGKRLMLKAPKQHGNVV